MTEYIFATFLSVGFALCYQFIDRLEPNGHLVKILKRAKPLIMVFAFIPLFILSGFRVNVGVDYGSYVQWFNNIMMYGNSYFEPGFMAMIEFLQSYTRDPQWLFITSSFIAIGGVFVAIKQQSVYPALSIFLFCTAGFLSHSMNLTRQFIAVAIILYGYRYLLNKKFIKYVVVVMIAALFHKTALIMLPVYFLLNAKLKLTHYILITAIAAMASVFQAQIINGLIVNFYPQYYSSAFVGESISSRYYLVTSGVLVVAIAYFLIKRKISIAVDRDRVLVNTVFLIMLSHTFFTWLPLSNRLSLYIDITLIIIIPLLISYISDRMPRVIIATAIISYFMYVAYLSLHTNANGILPYRSSLTYNSTTRQIINYKEGVLV